MPSTFTWLDYSERERRLMLDVISQFREKDTRDELGLGSLKFLLERLPENLVVRAAGLLKIDLSPRQTG